MMKKGWALFLCTFLLLLTGCAHYQDATDPTAPKTITSTELRSFFCFTEVKDAFPKQEENFTKWTIELTYCDKEELEDGTVITILEPYLTGKFYGIDGAGAAFSYEERFTPSATEPIQTLLEKYNIAQYNGMFYYSTDTKTDKGCDLSATYASGEEIYIYNVLSVPYPYDFCKELSDYAQELFDGTNDDAKSGQ